MLWTGYYSRLLRWTTVTFLVLVVPLRGATVDGGDETIDVKAFGVGVKPEDAEKNAVINAVQQAVGAYIDGESFIKNESLIYDRVLSVSNGFVNSVRIDVPVHKRPDGLYETAITANVKKGRVSATLTDAHLVTAAVNGRDLWAQAVAGLKDVQDANELLERRVPGVLRSLLHARVIDDEGREGAAAVPARKNEPSTGNVWCAWNIEVSIDRDRYYKEVAPRLEKILSALRDGQSYAMIERRSPVPERKDFRWSTMAITHQPLRMWLYEETHEPFPNAKRAARVFALSVRSDRTGQNQGFQPFVVDKDVSERILRAFRKPTLVVTLHGATGTEIARAYLSMDPLLIDSKKNVTEHHISIQAEAKQHPGDFMCSPGRPNVDEWYISPEFSYHNDGTWSKLVTERLLIRFEQNLDPDQRKEVREVRVDLEAPKDK